MWAKFKFLLYIFNYETDTAVEKFLINFFYQNINHIVHQKQPQPFVNFFFSGAFVDPNNQTRALLPESQTQSTAAPSLLHQEGIEQQCWTALNWTWEEQHKRSDYLRNAAVGQRPAAIHQDCVSTRRLGFCQRRFLTPRTDWEVSGTPPWPFLGTGRNWSKDSG